MEKPRKFLYVLKYKTHISVSLHNTHKIKPYQLVTFTLLYSRLEQFGLISSNVKKSYHQEDRHT